MPQYVYLDTNALRYFGIAFRAVTLAERLREKILISPLSAFEVFAQLADERDGDEVLSQIHATRNWTNPQHTGLLPWPDEMLYQLWFMTPIRDDEFTRKMTLSFNHCLNAASVAEIKAEAVIHKQTMDNFKLGTALHFKNMVDAARTFDLERAWFLGIASRVRGEPNSKPVSEVVSTLSAYYEFEESKLRTAIETPEYNPLSRKNQNDIIDAEQLVYLGDSSLCMLTSDTGFKSKVTKSKQASRIITVPPDDLMDAQKAEAVLRSSLLG